MGGSVVLSTPQGIAFYHLAALKGAVGLELAGMRHSRGSAVAEARRRYGFPKSIRREQVHQALCHLVEYAIEGR